MISTKEAVRRDTMFGDRPMVVLDPFELEHNLTKGVNFNVLTKIFAVCRAMSHYWCSVLTGAHVPIEQLQLDVLFCEPAVALLARRLGSVARRQRQESKLSTDINPCAAVAKEQVSSPDVSEDAPSGLWAKKKTRVAKVVINTILDLLLESRGRPEPMAAEQLYGALVHRLQTENASIFRLLPKNVFRLKYGAKAAASGDLVLGTALQQIFRLLKLLPEEQLGLTVSQKSSGGIFFISLTVEQASTLQQDSAARKQYVDSWYDLCARGRTQRAVHGEDPQRQNASDTGATMPSTINL